ncbi:MAG: LamB/YcsF family protein [Ferrimicrobium sp.]
MMIDLNSDLGEGFGVYHLGDDKEILNVVSSANIACGFHGGDPTVMARTVNMAASQGVAIGAHVSYPDRVGFGRRFIDVSAEDLTWDVVYQIGALDGMAKIAGAKVHYVKAHGALYNRISIDEVQARAFVEGVAAYDSSLVLVTMPDSAVVPIAKDQGLTTIAECFADRAYASNGRLIPREHPNAVIHDETEVVDRALQMAIDNTVVSMDGVTIQIEARSICVHGDTPGASTLARKIRVALEGAGVEILSFIRSKGA